MGGRHLIPFLGTFKPLETTGRRGIVISLKIFCTLLPLGDQKRSEGILIPTL